MEREDLLKEVFENCTLEEILDYGLDNCLCSSSDILDYADTLKTSCIDDFTDDEIQEIVSTFDLHVIMDPIKKRYSISDIVDELDEDDVLSCFNSDKVFDYFEWDFNAIKDQIREESYEEGFEEGVKNSQKPEVNPIKEGTIDDKWRYLCDSFDLTYHDDIGLYNKLNKLIQSLNKSTYKDKNNRQWININIE